MYEIHPCDITQGKKLNIVKKNFRYQLTDAMIHLIVISNRCEMGETLVPEQPSRGKGQLPCRSAILIKL